MQVFGTDERTNQPRRASTFLAFAALVFLVVVGLAAPSSAGSVRTPHEDDLAPYIKGSLVSDGTSHKIVWEEEASSSDNVMSQPQVTANDATAFVERRHLENKAGFCMNTVMWDVDSPVIIDPFERGWRDCSPVSPYVAGASEDAPAYYDEFVSAPFPRRMVVDVERGFNLLLYLKKNAENTPHTPCTMEYDVQPLPSREYSNVTWVEPSIQASMWIDGHPVGSAPPYPSDTGFWPGNGKPRIPYPQDADYGLCLHQMYSETLVLEKGSVLKLRISHELEQYRYAYGLQGKHRSVFYIYGLPASEILYRHPDLLDGANVDPVLDGGPATPQCDPASAGAPKTQGSAGLGMLGAAGLGARRGRRASLVILLLTVAFAGCLSGGGNHAVTAPPDATASGIVKNEIILDPCEEITSVGYGAILGQVHDDLHIALRNVHVTVKGLPHFADTDVQGRFSFLNLTPGEYQLRFDAADYKTLEVTVPVESKKVTKPDVQLALAVAKPADLRKHDHDYWDGRTQYTLPAIELGPQCPAQPTAPCTRPSLEFSFPPSADANALDTVIPGTGRVELTVTWDADKLGVTDLSLRAGRWQMPYLGPRASGIPFVIQTLDKEADLGHKKESDWRLTLSVPLSNRLTWDQMRLMETPGYDWGTITVSAKVVKGGPMPLGEPHKDFWATGDAVEIKQLNFPWDTRLDFKGSESPVGIGNFRGPPPCSGVPDGAPCGPMIYPEIKIGWLPGGGGYPIVAPGTKWLDITASLAREGDPLPYKITDLYYKDATIAVADSNPQTLAGYTKATRQGEASATAAKFRIPVADGMADDMYESQSMWRFTIRIDDETAAWADSIKNYQPLAWWDQRPDISIVRHRDPLA